jgi:bifunctional non-homologous end joining protein LigD
MSSTSTPDPLQRYQAKRNFAHTPEPPAKVQRATKALGFVVQKHWASRLHYDFRLELDGVLKSWAVPKGPSLDPGDKRMAVEVEDHPVAYAAFEGTIPPKQYGAGKVIVWDKGVWAPEGDPHEGLRAGNLKFELTGHKLQGRWALVRMKTRDEKKPAWLLIKERDAFARPAQEFSVVDAAPDSVAAKDLPRAGKAAAAKPAGEGGAWPPEAVRSALPEALAPQLATRAENPPAAEAEWLCEIKFDGYRMLARIEGAAVKLFTRSGHDWTHRLEPLRRALEDMRLPAGWYDGEIVVFNDQGLPDFGALQRSLENERTSSVVFYLFDLPHADGRDLRAAPLVARRAVLERLLRERPNDAVRFSAVFEESAASVLSSACRLGLEGVIAKRKDAPYRSARSADWLKLKCGQRQEFVIGGFTQGKGSRTGFGSLLLGLHQADGSLRHVGNVGTGFDARTLASLHRKLKALERRTSPFEDGVKLAGEPHWVTPNLVAEVAFSDWTHANHIRHAVFMGLREDKPAATVKKEVDVPKPNDSPAPVRTPAHPPVPSPGPPAPSSLRVTNPERVIDPGTGVTKLDLVTHYATVAPLMMEHLKQRPVALMRAPSGIQGELFFQKHVPPTMKMAGVVQLDPALDPDHDPWVAVASRQGLLSAAQWNVVEFHTQNALARSFEKPNRVVFDLDPGEGVAWAQVQEAAQLTRSLLEHLGLVSFLKTSGGKGLHVVVPVRQQHDWDSVKGFAQAVVRHMSDTIPQRFVAKSGPKNRIGKIFVDYLRNGRGATTVAAWSARARPGMGVSVPLDWDELPGIRGSDQWHVRNIAERLAVGNQPWKDYARSARSLSSAMKTLGFRP